MSFVGAILKFLLTICGYVLKEFINFTLHYIADLISQSKGRKQSRDLRVRANSGSHRQSPVYMLVHLALALRDSMEEERERKDDVGRDAEEKGGGQASSSHDTTMTENVGIMSDGASTSDLMASIMLVTGCPWVEYVVRNMMQFMIVHEFKDIVFLQ
ncbi:hypothetical protein C5167_007570 [Papaver somniferum]|nr:hypothetical protein C5167_007570 [Papaver somniferum]